MFQFQEIEGKINEPYQTPSIFLSFYRGILERMKNDWDEKIKY